MSLIETSKCKGSVSMVIIMLDSLGRDDGGGGVQSSSMRDSMRILKYVH